MGFIFLLINWQMWVYNTSETSANPEPKKARPRVPLWWSPPPPEKKAHSRRPQRCSLLPPTRLGVHGKVKGCSAEDTRLTKKVPLPLPRAIKTLNQSRGLSWRQENVHKCNVFLFACFALNLQVFVHHNFISKAPRCISRPFWRWLGGNKKLSFCFKTFFASSFVPALFAKRKLPWGKNNLSFFMAFLHAKIKPVRSMYCHLFVLATIPRHEI